MVPYFKDQGPKTHFYNPNIKPCLKESRSVKWNKIKIKTEANPSLTNLGAAQPKLVDSKQFKIMEWKSKLTPYGV